ncbi:MAG: ParB N-terminal domain-containing protein [Clostridia bacterium]|nr:ParB N-terminal domain-containing protein [Clostridia bacterium]
MASMEVEWLGLDEIKPYAFNPRNNKESITYVVNSIKEFGFRNPIIVDRDGTIIAGHTRYEAAKHLHMDKVPCIRAEDLTEEQVKAFRLADNKVGEYSLWTDMLGFELKGLTMDMTKFGFNDLAETPEVKPVQELNEMELKQFEHYDYIVFVFRNEGLWSEAVTRFGLEDVEINEGKTRKTGLGRVLDGKVLIEKLNKK